MDPHVLLNIAHQERRPRSDRGAAFRILGVFETVEGAKSHAAHLPTDASLHLLPIRKWTPLMRCEDCSAEEQTEHLVKLGDRHRRRAEAHAEEFAENVAKRQTGRTAIDDGWTPPTAQKALPPPASDADDFSVSSVPRNLEVRLQKFAVLSIIGDDAEPDSAKQQPAILIWGATETEAEAKELIKTELAEDAADVHLDVVAMYEWLFPTAVDPEQITEEYRDKRLDELMQHRKTEKRRIATFRKKCVSEGYEAPVISLDTPAAAGADASSEQQAPPPRGSED